MTHPPSRPGSRFPAIEDFALLADGETTALVAPDGSVEWLCAPRMDSPSLFTALLDRHAGRFRLAPAGSAVPTARRYVPGTLVLETTYMTPRGGSSSGRAARRSWDALDCGTLPPYRRTPRDHRAAHVLARTARCEHGSVELQLHCDPGFDFGRRRGPGRSTRRRVAGGRPSPTPRGR
jgi:GH15 family glucan-1,4-alpha-glucosidase